MGVKDTIYILNIHLFKGHYAAQEGHLPCLKFLVSMGISPTHILGARNDQGETPKDLAQQFYKDNIIEYINGIEWERDHPEEAESKLSLDLSTLNLTHYQMTNFRLFQTERVCRRQFQI